MVDSIPLDLSARCDEIELLQEHLRAKLIGQAEVVEESGEILYPYLAGLNDPSRPLFNMLLLGPTGTGKTRLVELVSKILLGDERKFLKIDCAEYQHSHEVLKITGAPPSYTGHRDTKTRITQQILDQQQSDKYKISIVLFDEIEKAHEAMWKLLLGILDKGELTLSNSDKVNFNRTLIFFTANIGADKIQALFDNGLGFGYDKGDDHLDTKVDVVARESATKTFSPEFMNRLDKVVVFRPLERESLRRILDLELEKVQKRVLSGYTHRKFILICGPEAKEFLIDKGTTRRHGARPLKRAVERYVTKPLSIILLSQQVKLGDLVLIDVEGDYLKFSKIPEEAVDSLPDNQWADYKSADQ